MYSRDHAFLPENIVPFNVRQKLVRPVALEDHCGVLLLSRYLDEVDWIVGLQNLLLPMFAEPFCRREDEMFLLSARELLLF